MVIDFRIKIRTINFGDLSQVSKRAKNILVKGKKFKMNNSGETKIAITRYVFRGQLANM